MTRTGWGQSPARQDPRSWLRAGTCWSELCKSLCCFSYCSLVKLRLTDTELSQLLASAPNIPVVQEQDWLQVFKRLGSKYIFVLKVDEGSGIGQNKKEKGERWWLVILRTLLSSLTVSLYNTMLGLSYVSVRVCVWRKDWGDFFSFLFFF